MTNYEYITHMSVDEVSKWLSIYLEDAKNMYEEVRADYEEYLWSKI